uniref:Uncharacterized protein n=1 Tax=Romanomermis culicivorax TaxID=13658 RepID=A0A915KQS5_ROMCU
MENLGCRSHQDYYRKIYNLLSLIKRTTELKDSFAERGGLSIISKSGGLKPNAVAGKPSVTKFTHNNWTGIKASGMPKAAVKNNPASLNLSQIVIYRSRDRRTKQPYKILCIMLINMYMVFKFMREEITSICLKVCVTEISVFLTNFGFFQRRRVVHAVAGHGRYFTFKKRSDLLQKAYMCITYTFCIFSLVEKPDSPSNSFGGIFVITGDHDDPDSSVTALNDGFFHFSTGRIQHSDL